MSWVPERTRWSSGPWSLELRDDELADISFAGSTVLRSIRAVVRDRDWNTLPLEVLDVQRGIGTLSLALRTSAADAELSGVLSVDVGTTDVTVSLSLTTGADVVTSRAGLVVLHPPTIAGAPLRIGHPDGSVTSTAFPTRISPHQPAMDIAELAWRTDTCDVDLRFEGDVFEMEDQRNWTDASFKTYSRPLAEPFPYALTAGTTVRQQVRVRVGRRGVDAPSAPNAITLVRAGRFPVIAAGASTAPDPAPALESATDVVLVEPDLTTANWRAALDRAAASGCALDVRFVVGPGDDQLDEAAATLAGLRTVRVAAFASTGPAAHVSDAPTVMRLRSSLARTGLDVPVVGGTRAHFTELNRERHRLPDDLDGVVFSSTPLFHDRSSEQLIEALAMQRLTAEQAVSDANGRPVHVGPLTLRPRFNNVATTPPPCPRDASLSGGYGPELIDADDERQDAPELAAWTIASAAAFAIPGVSSITFFEEWGPRGIADSTGADRPVARALRALAAMSGAALWSGASPDGRIWALGGDDTEGLPTTFLANLDRYDRRVRITTPAGSGDALVPAGAWIHWEPSV